MEDDVRDSTLRVLATFRIKEDGLQQFLEVMQSLREPIRAEHGCVAYYMQQSLDDPLTFVFVEEWRSEAALAEHLTSSHVQEATPTVMDLLAAPPETARYRPIW